METKIKNIIALLLATLLVGFSVFAIFNWLLDKDWKESMDVAISGALAGLLAPLLVNYFKRMNENKKLSE